MSDFDPRNHRFCETRWFEDYQVGERFYINSRTQTDAMFTLFQAVSGDNHPIHYDIEYCRARGHRGLLAHGLQVLVQTVAGGGVFPHMAGDALVAFVDVQARFLKPVYAGDTLYPMLEITELKPGRSTGTIRMRATIHNQAGELVLDGSHTYLLRKRPSTLDAPTTRV